jgi:hypothetical protein
VAYAAIVDEADSQAPASIAGIGRKSMTSAAIMQRIAEVSPRFKARIAGVIYVFSVLTAVFFELFLGGRLGSAANFVQMSGMAAVSLIFYDIFKPVNRSVSLLAASSNLAGIACEALRLTPPGVNIAMLLHGCYCLLIAYLIFRSTFLPRILGVPMALAGWSWPTFLLAPLAKYLSPYNLACGLLGEAAVMLWLLVMGVNVERWKEQASEGTPPFAHENPLLP